ncbi:uncharacterized protein [Solanum lycopersicum]|uniref:Uncharacterized protein n=1 Tax=Solanum lycopersicum TaxID=4081 RepID=A0A3Q7HTL2_SOLLC|nr:uncharacterized protein LOC101261438 [Solanum lycopersicum]
MFDPRNQKPIDHIHILDPVTPSDYTCNNNSPKNDVGGLEMSQQHVDDSGISSPPLWKNRPSTSPDHPFHNSTNHRSISPSSRALAIAKGQWELMEMIKNMPESCYELSLKDLVEKNSILESNQEECLINKEEENFSTSQEQVVVQRVKSGKKKGKMIRNESFEEKGSFLKMFFPIPPKTISTKVSPKPVEGSKSLEKDWWKKRFSCSSESDSSKTGSSNSESSGSNDSTTSTQRKKKGFLTNFWSRSCFSKSKSAE